MGLKLGNIQIFPNQYYFDFMKWRRITVGFSALLMLLSIAVIGVKGLNYSIDFLGGAEFQINLLSPDVSQDQIKSILHKGGFPAAELTSYNPLNSLKNQSTFIVRLPRHQGQDENGTLGNVNQVIKNLQDTIGSDKIQIASVTNISGKIGREDEYKGYLALIFACIGILIYIALRFDIRFAPGAVLCLVHNVVIAIGFMTFLGRPFTLSSIAAFLTIVGYSINDTVIVYDRVRETRLLEPGLPMVDVVNRSISQTMNRTILTSTTGILALIVLATVGRGSIEDFALTMLIGIVVGTYSSIYVSAPLTLMMDGFFQRFGLKDRVVAKSKVALKEQAPTVFIRKEKL